MLLVHVQRLLVVGLSGLFGFGDWYLGDPLKLLAEITSIKTVELLCREPTHLKQMLHIPCLQVWTRLAQTAKAGDMKIVLQAGGCCFSRDYSTMSDGQPPWVHSSRCTARCTRQGLPCATSQQNLNPNPYTLNIGYCPHP